MSPPNERFSPGAQPQPQTWVNMGLGDCVLVPGLWPLPGPSPTPLVCTHHHHPALGIPCGTCSALYREEPISCSKTDLQGGHDCPFPTDVDTRSEEGQLAHQPSLPTQAWGLDGFCISQPHTPAPATCLVLTSKHRPNRLRHSPARIQFIGPGAETGPMCLTDVLPESQKGDDLG